MVFGHLPFHFRENDTVAFLFFLFQVKERAAAAGVTIRCNSVDSKVFGYFSLRCSKKIFCNFRLCTFATAAILMIF